MTNDLSVIVPVRDAARTLGEALESVLVRADGLLELLVVDDASTDGSAEVARSLGARVTLLRGAGGGVASARNAGIRRASGALVGFLDGDDLWAAPVPDPRRRLLESEPDLDGVRGRLHCAVEDGRGGLRTAGPPFHSWSFPAGLFRRGAFERAGLLDEEFRQSEDVDWFLRAREKGLRIGEVPDVCVLYRQEPGSLTRTDAGERDRWLLRALHASVRRRTRGRGAA